MKKTLLVILAMVMMLTMVIGSVSTVSAKGKPVRTVSVDLEYVDTVYSSHPIYVAWAWDNYRANGWDVTITDDVTETVVYYQQLFFIDQNPPQRVITTYSWGYVGDPSADYHVYGQGVTPDPSHAHTIVFSLIRSNGRPIVTVSDTWTPTP